MSTRGSEFTGPINRIFDPINRCNFVHVRTDVIPFQVNWPNKTADPLNRRPNKVDSTVITNNRGIFNLIWLFLIIHYRKGDKKSCKPRRITLTAIQPSPHTEAWLSHPAFTAGATTTESPSTLSEERRLLRQERSRRGGRRNRTWLASQTKRDLQAAEHPSLSVESESAGSRETQVLNFSSGKRIDDGRRGMRNCELFTSNELPEGSCQQGGFQQTGHKGCDSQLGACIKDGTVSDLKNTQSVKGPVSSKGGTVLESKGLLSSPCSAGFDSTTLISTTDPSPMLLQGHAEVSIRNVSNKQSLDAAAELYSALIIGIYMY